ncbi:MAG: hypothetical protein AMXMBFR82_00710 [Candidatus Hydrogenedentota bacterium]
MKLRRALIALALVAFVSTTAFAATIVPGTPNPVGEKELYEIFNELYGTAYTGNNDAAFLALQVMDFQTFVLDPDVESITFEAVYRQSYLEDDIYLYSDVDNIGKPAPLTHIVGPIDNTGPNSGQGALSEPAVNVNVSGLGEIGFLDKAKDPTSPFTFEWYSQKEQNNGQFSTGTDEVHVLLWAVPGMTDTYVLTWEDLPFTYFAGNEDIGDQDYNDILIQFTLNRTVIPEPSSMALLGLGLAGLAVRKFRKNRLA